MLSWVDQVVTELRAHYDDPEWRRERVSARINEPFHRHVYRPLVRHFHPRRGDGVTVMDEDWDTLLVLDACRADLFEEVADLETFDTYRRVQSLGGASEEWTRRNFEGQAFGDTVYVTANPYVSVIAGDAFHDLVEVWKTDFDEEAGTVRAEAVADAARQAHDEYPDKRLVVHFMQPHRPFVAAPDLLFEGWRPETITGERENSNESQVTGVIDALNLGEVDHDEVWAGYAANLEYVLEHALALAADLDGRTVFTADHGNCFGERGWPVPIPVYSHPAGLRYRQLVEVPWAVDDGESRRGIVDEGTRSVREHDEDELTRKLRHLGYA